MGRVMGFVSEDSEARACQGRFTYKSEEEISTSVIRVPSIVM
jgi:hypothetical protein